jgi:hypothetical protein
VNFVTVDQDLPGYIVLTETLTRRRPVNKTPIILSTVLATALFVLPSVGAYAANFQICKSSSLEKRTCLQHGGKWDKLTCDCLAGGSNAAVSISTNGGGTPGAGNPGEEPGNPGGAPGGTETSSAAGNPGNGKDVGNAGEKGKDNEPDNSGTSGSGNDPDKGGKGDKGGKKD